MDGKTNESLQSLFPSRFVPFTQAKPRRRGKREEAGGLLSRTGILRLNANGSDLATAVIRGATATLGTCGILWAPDLEANEIAGAIVSPETKGVTPIRQDKHGRYTVYMTDLFDHHTELKAFGGNKVMVSRPAGLNILIVHLSVSLTKNSKSRSSEESTDSAQTADKAAKAKPAKTTKSAAKKKGEAAAAAQEPESDA